MKHENIDIDAILKLLPLISSPKKKSNKLIRIAKGYYSIKKSKSTFTWLKR